MFILRWLDDNAEKTIILISYVVMAGIIFIEVIRRFAIGQQAPWSSTIPVYLFLWVVWAGCAQNVKLRTHLRFDEFRSRLGYTGQYLCLLLDAALWIIFSLIVIYFTAEQVRLSRDNFAIVAGTNDTMQWWFYLATPVCFSLVIFRVLQNMWRDFHCFRQGQPFNLPSTILAD
jgi:TRAP-type C4-dicarboxylate transport system permease small subunit